MFGVFREVRAQREENGKNGPLLLPDPHSGVWDQQGGCWSGTRGHPPLLQQLQYLRPLVAACWQRPHFPSELTRDASPAQPPASAAAEPPGAPGPARGEALAGWYPRPGVPAAPGRPF